MGGGGRGIGIEGERPRCARCLREVDRLERSLCRRTGTITITAFCHGETESVDITTEDMHHAALHGSQADVCAMNGIGSFRFTVAFSRTRKAERRKAVPREPWDPLITRAPLASFHEMGGSREPARAFLPKAIRKR